MNKKNRHHRIVARAELATTDRVRIRFFQTGGITDLVDAILKYAWLVLAVLAAVVLVHALSPPQPPPQPSLKWKIVGALVDRALSRGPAAPPTPPWGVDEYLVLFLGCAVIILAAYVTREFLRRRSLLLVSTGEFLEIDSSGSVTGSLPLNLRDPSSVSIEKTTEGHWVRVVTKRCARGVVVGRDDPPGRRALQTAVAIARCLRIPTREYADVIREAEIKRVHCPRCNLPAKVRVVGRLTVDECPECGSVWIDGLELSEVAGPKIAAMFEKNERRGAPTEKTLTCPRDGSELERFRAGAVDYDVCTICSGVFLGRDAVARCHAASTAFAIRSGVEIAGEVALGITEGVVTGVEIVGEATVGLLEALLCF